MATTKSKISVAVALLVFMGLGAYWHYSPYLTIKSMRTAAEAKNADDFNQYVDYPKLRESLKGQMTAMLVDGIGSKSAAAKPFETAGAALALAFVNPVIDALVRPELVMKAMSQGEVDMKPAPPSATESKKEPKWDFQRVNVNKLIAYAKDPNDPASEKVGVVFERSGFADWKLTELRLPAARPK